ncbi:efflux RND transporter periplasmic adaptor subunit [Xanthobacter versatilis]|uniref:efflux RND transporter periplasmic adaptor subunit n=1 Tax=Xanthobacter autotrophicus (strain ATCC BAA-1158 / Py2) TaxID=78245 RepID=UPI0037281CDB
MNNLIRGILGSLAVAGLGISATYYISRTAAETPPGQSASPATPQPDANVVTVDPSALAELGIATGAAELREIRKVIRTSGVVAFDERRIAHVKARTQGRVLSLAVRPGDRVSAGTVLATLDASGVLDARNGLAAAQAALTEAQVAARIAEIALDRGNVLVQGGRVAQIDLERRQIDAAKARAAVQSAQAQVDLYAAQYERLAPPPGEEPGTSAIVSPISGVVVELGVTLGDVVDASRDALIIADPSQVLVKANLFGDDIALVNAGNPAVVTAPGVLERRYEGRVASVNPSLDMATNTALARVEIANAGGALKANMYVTVEITADLGRRGVTVPASAIQQTEEGPIAFVELADGAFERRPVTLGLQRADWVEVREGVTAGETVATAGSFALKAILLRALLGSGE